MDITEQLTPPAMVLEILAKSLNFGSLGHTPRPSSAEKAYINGVRDLGMHKYDRAVEFLTEAVRVSETDKDKSEADLELYALSLGALGFAKAGQASLEEALSLYKQTLPLWEQIYGVNNTKISCVHSDIALLLENLGKPLEAFEALTAAREALILSHGPDNVEVQGLTLAMAANLSRRQQLENSEDLFLAAINNLRKHQRAELGHGLAMYYEHLQAYSKTDRAKEIKAELSALTKNKR